MEETSDTTPPPSWLSAHGRLSPDNGTYLTPLRCSDNPPPLPPRQKSTPYENDQPRGLQKPDRREKTPKASAVVLPFLQELRMKNNGESKYRPPAESIGHTYDYIDHRGVKDNSSGHRESEYRPPAESIGHTYDYIDHRGVKDNSSRHTDKVAGITDFGATGVEPEAATTAAFGAESHDKAFTRRPKPGNVPKKSFTTYENDRRITMPCGHAFTSEDLYIQLIDTLDSNSIILKCPFETNGKQCGKEWEHALVCKAAELVGKEIRQVEKRMSEISLAEEEIRQCPKCNMTCVKDGGGRHVRCASCKFPFCWNCLQDWHPRGQHGCDN